MGTGGTGGTGDDGTGNETSGSGEPTETSTLFTEAVNRLLDAVEDTNDDDEMDLQELRDAAYAVESALPETFDDVEIPLREVRLIGALCRLASDISARPRLVVARKGVKRS